MPIHRILPDFESIARCGNEVELEQSIGLSAELAVAGIDWVAKNLLVHGDLPPMLKNCAPMLPKLRLWLTCLPVTQFAQNGHDEQEMACSITSDSMFSPSFSIWKNSQLNEALITPIVFPVQFVDFHLRLSCVTRLENI